MNDALQDLRSYLHRRSGLAPDAGSAHFVQSRLEPLARTAGLDGVPDLARRIAAGDEGLGRAAIEAMTTRETYFFRDRAVFGCLAQEILPRLHAARVADRRLRLWSAACSTGQEAYSLAMLLDEAFDTWRGWSIDIAASDLSGQAIEAARRGRYNRFEVQRGLSTGRLLRYFAPAGDDWVIAEHLRERVRFGAFNLLDDVAGFGPCDVILCRNLFLYFDEATTRGLLARLARILTRDGVLIIGAAESIRGLSSDFVPHPNQPGVLLREPGSRFP